MPRIQFIGKDEQILRTIKVLCKGYHIVYFVRVLDATKGDTHKHTSGCIQPLPR